MIHVYSQERDLFVSFFICLMSPYFFFFFFGGGGGGCCAPTISFFSTDLFIFVFIINYEY